jgi:hypothetical protein
MPDSFEFPWMWSTVAPDMSSDGAFVHKLIAGSRRFASEIDAASPPGRYQFLPPTLER